ncbi:hypothetical protein FGG08_005114 [Glutinoglossum americanum]|uniref:Uncharacterized protein n=1 Tax=Glutinoglossum americanum TaxID=1670608 RepID=A0A9P8I0Z8_9PEZI|nr:hypothetical protein FGG08_005114 [Glutinoglossum americanum]
MAPLSLSGPDDGDILNRDVYVHPPRAGRDISGAGIPSLEYSADGDATAPDTLSRYLTSLGLGGEATGPKHGGLLKRGAAVSPLSPRDVGILGRGVIVNRNGAPRHGAGAVGPNSINNRGMLALFALLFSGLIISAIWFFFWAKNGGFRFREGDWEDYKSTVLRRKGPNGTTLSGATKTTDLGQESLAGSFDVGNEEMEEAHGRDNDVRQYRHETPAKVGGINREPDGSYYDRDSTDRSSDITAEPSAARGKRGFWHRSGGKPSAAPNRQPSTAYSFTEGDDGTTVSGASEYTRPTQRSSRQYRPSHQHRHRTSDTSSRRHQHHQHHHHHHPPPTTISEVSYDDEEEEASDLGTKIYTHSVPGLLAGSALATTTRSSEVSRSEASYVPEERRRDRDGGYRRGGGRRRDSLSESEGETVA